MEVCGYSGQEVHKRRRRVSVRLPKVFVFSLFVSLIAEAAMLHQTQIKHGPLFALKKMQPEAWPLVALMRNSNMILIDKSTRAHAHTHASRLFPPTTHTASNNACPTTRRRGAGRHPFGCLERSSLHPAHARRRLAPAAAAAMRIVPVLYRVGKRPDHVSRSKREEGREHVGGWVVGWPKVYCLCACLSCSLPSRPRK